MTHLEQRILGGCEAIPSPPEAVGYFAYRAPDGSRYLIGTGSPVQSLQGYVWRMCGCKPRVWVVIAAPGRTAWVHECPHSLMLAPPPNTEMEVTL